MNGERLKTDHSTLILRKTANVPLQTKMKNSSTVDNIPQQTRYFYLLNSLFAKIINPQSNTALNTHDSPTISTRKLFIEPLEIFRAITGKLLRGYCSYLTFTQVTIVIQLLDLQKIFISIERRIPVLVNISLFNKFNLYIHRSVSLDIHEALLLSKNR